MTFMTFSHDITVRHVSKTTVFTACHNLKNLVTVKKRDMTSCTVTRYYKVLHYFFRLNKILNIDF